MFTNKKLIILVILLSSFVLQACGSPVGGPSYPATVIPITSEAADSLKISMAEAVAQGALSGNFSLQLTEAQLTSTLAINLSQQNLIQPNEPIAPGEMAEPSVPQEQANPLVSNPQVFLRNGQMQVYGTLQYGLLSTTGRVVLTVVPDAQGNLVLDLVAADFGSMPIPENLKTTISSALSLPLNIAFGPITSGFRVETITIANGLMTLTGKTR